MDEHVTAGTTCPACESRNREGRKFCAECGASLASPCPSCGTANEPGERFCGECGTALEPGATPVPAATPSGVERRLVSVLFADLVGHTALSEQRDVEDVRELLSRYSEVARTIVERYGGEVEKFIGDAVMAVWGTPTALEDDAERAVRAALDLMPAVAALGGEVGAPALSVRAAVLTGEAAVTLRAQGQGMVAGDLVNTASRVQALAEPGTVLVGDSTRRATEAAIAYEDAGAHELKGKAEPVPLWRALRVTAGRRGSLTSDLLEPPFVGRERELRLLKELFHASADERKAHLASVVGIAGIGKSRLAFELQKYFDGVAETVQWHRGRCLAYGEGVSYWALAEMVRMRADIVDGEEPESARAKLRSALERYVDDGEEREWIEPRLAQLLALEGPGEGDRSDLFAGWRLFLERLAERDPVALVFEDMQWADAALLEFLEYLLEWSRGHRLFVLALARPELGERHPGWGSSIRNSTTLSVEPLSDESMEELLDGFVPGLPEDIRRQVLERAEGVPLYAVETVRMLLDRGLLERQGRQYRPTGTIAALEIPETLHALVAARLDALTDEERRLVQDASVVGKTFVREALVALTGIRGDEVDSLLQALTRKEILSLEVDPRSPERGQYAFLQDLLRQVAYETMPRAERKSRHLAVAAYFEQDSPEAEQEVAEIVASHYLRALELDPKADDTSEIEARAQATLVTAGERAASLAATESAQRYYERALELTSSPLERAELHERAGNMAVRGDRTREARSHLEHAVEAFVSLGHSHRAARVAARLATEVTWHQEHDIERALVDMERSFAELADDEHDADLALLAVQSARILYFSGRIDEAMARNELALEIAEALQLPLVLSHGLNTKGIRYSQHGRREEGMLLMRHALEIALAHDLAEPAIRGYMNLCSLIAAQNRFREALHLSRAGADLARKIGQSGELGLESWTVGLLVILGEWDEAVEIWEALGDLSYPPLDPYVHRGDLDEARRRLKVLRDHSDLNETQERAGLREAEAFLLVAESNPSEALVAAEEALACRAELGLTHVQQALELALEAAFSLGDRAKSDELLGIVEGLPPGELTPLLRAFGARFGARRAGLDRDHATAHAGFLAAADIFREIEMPFDLAVVRLEHAEWLASVGRAVDAAPLLGEARTIFERLRATPWLERVARVERAPAQPAVVD